MSNLFEKFVKLDNTHYTETFSLHNKKWNFERHEGCWVGGRMSVNNLSLGYHGILKQWWEHYCDVSSPKKILLISEGKNCKKDFESVYPNWIFKTTDKYYDLQSETDIVADLCQHDSLPKNEFDVVICQATFEHLHDPFGAINNLKDSLKNGGFLYIHTHPPGFFYHSFPRDYFRFMKDWWYDIPVFIKSLSLYEFYMEENQQVFIMYKKI